MITIKSALIGFFTGCLLTIAWVIFIDGQITSHDRFPPLHIIPPLFAMIAAVMVNLVSINDINSSIIIKVWLFVWFTIQSLCIGSSIYILSTNYPPDDNYAGVTILIQTILVMFASFIFFIGRKKENGDFSY